MSHDMRKLKGEVWQKIGSSNNSKENFMWKEGNWMVPLISNTN